MELAKQSAIDSTFSILFFLPEKDLNYVSQVIRHRFKNYENRLQTASFSELSNKAKSQSENWDFYLWKVNSGEIIESIGLIQSANRTLN